MLKPIKIKSIKSIGLQPVYDIEMPTKHNFVLENGAVAHNCEYAHITYACMFLKHYYKLEWWAAVLTNATEREITGNFWPYVKDMVSSPDINLSTDTMVVDYKNEKIRSKFGVIRGISDATIGPIVENRPYKDIADFIEKDVAGNSLTCKLIHVGVLDSLFPPKTNLIEKIQLYQETLQGKIYSDRMKTLTLEGKKSRSHGPKAAVIPVEYTELDKDPLRDARMKKAILPSLTIDLHSLGLKHSKLLVNPNRPYVKIGEGHHTMLINGEALHCLSEKECETMQKDMYVAATCYVIDTEEFSYPKKNPTKKALKLTLDADGFVETYVLWPEYESGELVYPQELKKGVIATVFFRKRSGNQNGRNDLSITGIAVET